MDHLILLCAGLSVAIALWGGLLVGGEIHERLNKRREGTEIFPSRTDARRPAAKRRTQPKVYAFPIGAKNHGRVISWSYAAGNNANHTLAERS